MTGSGAPARAATDLRGQPKEGAVLREHVLEALRGAILEFRLAPGQRLIERELMERTGVSRTTIREVLRQLGAEGLVRMIPRRGAVVNLPSAEEAADLYELRGPIEALAGRSFVRHASGEQIQALREAHQRLAGLPTSESIDMYALLAAQDAFYGALLAGVANHAVRETLGGLHGRVRILRAAALASPERVASMLRETAVMVAAAEARNEEAMAGACAEHVAQAGARALSAQARANAPAR